MLNVEADCYTTLHNDSLMMIIIAFYTSVNIQQSDGSNELRFLSVLEQTFRHSHRLGAMEAYSSHQNFHIIRKVDPPANLVGGTQPVARETLKTK